ncbi:MAG: hypothetical protein ACR2G2_11970 [Pseudonocardia sp.]
MRGERRVEAVGEQLRLVHALGADQRFVGELHRAGGLAGVGPAAGERSRETCPVRVVGGTDQHVVQLRRQLARLGAEHVHRRRAQHRARPPGEVVLALAAGDRLVVQTRRQVPSTGRAGGVGAVEGSSTVGGRLIAAPS